MAFKNILDQHMHTDNSPDAEHSAMVMCEAAIDRGLRAVAFTDHCEVQAYREQSYDRIAAQSCFSIMKARSVFFGKLIVSAGVELGQPCHDAETAGEIKAKYPYDIVLACVHNLKGEQDFYYLNYHELDVKALLDRYFAEIYETVRWNGFDVLAHLTYPLRYICGKAGISVGLKKDHGDAMAEILRLLAQNGRALEINTSGLRQPYGKTMPEEEWVKAFRQYGGEFVTVGSDAHRIGDVAAGVTQGMEVALRAGFKYVALYQKRTSTAIAIE